MQERGGSEEGEVDDGGGGEDGEGHVEVAAVVETDAEQGVEESADGEGDEVRGHAVQADPAASGMCAVVPDDICGGGDVEQREGEAPTGV